MRFARFVCHAVFATMVLAASLAQAPVADPLLGARQAYNDRKFDEAIALARIALKTPSTSNVAAVVLSRSLLERYRLTFDTADLVEARAVLAGVRPAELTARTRFEFLVGLGVALYLDGCTDGCLGASAEFFDQALQRATPADVEDREIAFEWWATVLDRLALYSQESDRAAIYRRILSRAEEERTRRDSSTSAAFWIASAARGLGDFDRAWGAAVSGWIGARYQGTRGKALRDELDRFVTEVLLPERAKALVPDADPRPELAGLLKQWDDIKQRYK
jgi:hypothetical protein